MRSFPGTDLDLIQEWEKRKAKGVTLQEYADFLGVTRTALDSKIKRARARTAVSEANAPQEGSSVAEDGNYLYVESCSKRIKTYDELVETFKIDLNVWEPLVLKPNKWEVGRKATRVSLDFDAGKITGNIRDEGGFTVEPLYQIKATFIRKHPVPLSPIIQPVNITTSFPKSGRASKLLTGLYCTLIIPDIHLGFRKDLNTGKLFPYHDRIALDTVLQIAKALPFDRIVFLGDNLDMAEWTDKFIRTPDFYFVTQPAIIELAWWLGQFRLACPNSEIDYIEGNHEQRVTKQLAIHLNYCYKLKAAHEMALPPALSVARLLNLDGLRIKWHEGYPDNEVWLADNIKCVHGDTARSGPGATASAMISDSSITTIFGHIHRQETATRTMFLRDKKIEIRAVSPGCLCHTDGRVPGNDKSQNWQQGFAIATYRLDGFHAIETVPIQDGVAICFGRQFLGQDQTRGLIKDTNWAF